MRKFALFVVISLCAACTVHNKPAANIQFSRMESIKESYKIGQIEGVAKTYKLYFTSDIDILNLFKSGGGLVTKRLICALEDDTAFSVKHTIERTAEGGISSNGSKLHDANEFGYVSDIVFS